MKLQVKPGYIYVTLRVMGNWDIGEPETLTYTRWVNVEHITTIQGDSVIPVGEHTCTITLLGFDNPIVVAGLTSTELIGTINSSKRMH